MGSVMMWKDEAEVMRRRVHPRTAEGHIFLLIDGHHDLLRTGLHNSTTPCTTQFQPRILLQLVGAGVERLISPCQVFLEADCDDPETLICEVRMMDRDWSPGASCFPTHDSKILNYKRLHDPLSSVSVHRRDQCCMRGTTSFKQSLLLYQVLVVPKYTQCTWMHSSRFSPREGCGRTTLIPTVICLITRGGESHSGVIS